jgi:hypothetical protein
MIKKYRRGQNETGREWREIDWLPDGNLQQQNKRVHNLILYFFYGVFVS